MTKLQVYIDGIQRDIVSDITIKRNVSSIVSACTFTTPLDLLAEAQAQSSVLIKRGDAYPFLGEIQTYSLDYQGNKLKLSLNCVDSAYGLATSARVSFAAGTTAQQAIVALLAGTGISTDGVVLGSTALPTDCFVFPINSNRLEAVKKISSGVGALFYLQFTGSTPVAVCASWATLIATSDFTTTIAVTDSTYLSQSFGLNAAPDNPTADRAMIAMAGMPAFLFNQLNLSSLYKSMGISYPVSTWRIIDLTHTLKDTGVTTVYTLIDPDIDLSPTATASSVATQDTPDLIRRETVIQINQAMGRVGEVIGTGTGTVTVAYETTSEEETVSDHGAV